MSHRSDSDYEVGFGRPPVRNRWPKGKSGNPSGRPKGRKSLLTHFRNAVSEKVTVKEGNRTRKVSKLEASFIQLATKAASGDLRAVRELVALADRLGLSQQELREAMPEIHVHFVEAKDGKPA